MKKIQILALSAFVTLGVAVTSCDSGGVVGGTSVKTDIDTLSYVMGVSMAENITQDLQQLGIWTDTAALRASYESRIRIEADAAKKSDLEKEYKQKLDSVNSANKKNMAEFLKGLNQVVNMGDDKKAFSAGLLIGSNLRMQLEGFEKNAFGESSDKKISKRIFVSAVETVLNGDSSQIASANTVLESKMKDLREAAQARQVEETKAKYAENQKAGENYLANYKTEAGVTTTPSGVAYKVLKEGTGAKPSATDQVKVNYHGTLIDGTVFDSSVNRGEPVTFPVNQVIPGWTEVLQLMPVGSKWQVVIPAEMAYNERDMGTIKPFSTLIFEVELLSIEKAPQQAAPQQQRPAQR